ncbi:MAG: SpoIIE family protein phosphatase, partial [Blastocatellia bacterium]
IRVTGRSRSEHMLSQITSSTYAAPVRRAGKEPASASAVETNNHSLIEIRGAADPEEARRVSSDLAKQAAFDDSVAERAALIASEAAANILRYAGSGQMLARVIGKTEPVVEIIALDRGPGIAHLSAAMRDGYSTSGAAGMGLHTISRASNLFDIYSRPGQGTALLAQVWARSLRYYATTLDYASLRVKSGAISTPRPSTGAPTLSDAWAMKHQPSRSLIMVANGLGQGAEAAGAAATAVRVMEEVHALSPAEILELVHERLSGTRGASVAVAELRLSDDARAVRFAGVGNISARVVSDGKTHHLVSLDGIAGYEAEIREFTYPWPAHSALVMHSDGLLTGWNADDYPGLLASHPALTAAVLHRDFKSGLDDATVVVAK